MAVNNPTSAEINPVGGQAIVTAELEIYFSRKKPSEPADSRFDAGLISAIRTIDPARLTALTLVLNEVENRACELSSISTAIPEWPRLESLVVRLADETPGPIPEALNQFFQACQSRDIHLRIDFLLGAHANGFDVLAENQAALQSALKMSRMLRQSGIPIRWLIPMIGPLVYRLEGLVSLAHDEEIEPLLLPPEIVALPDTISDLKNEERLFLWDFVNYRMLGSDRHLLKPGQAAYYHRLLVYLESQRLDSASASIAVLTQEGFQDWHFKSNTLPGANLRTAALAGTCTGTRKTSKVRPAIAFGRDVAGVLLDGVRGHFLRFIAGAASSEEPVTDRIFKNVLLIGAYGGEHIGDTAILAGVLHRMHEHHGTRTGVVLSQRLAHTRHLLAMLDTSVQLSADIYERAQIRKHVATTDCIVFAGGPLIDLPKQLVRHLYAVALARKLGKPFIAEGIGPRPFVRMPSKFTAQRLMEMANRISIRSTNLADHKILQGLDVEISYCPAFDYLQTRDAELTRLPLLDKTAINDLLEGTEGRPLIGINIRPIGDKYTVGAPDGDVAAYTREIEDRFEHRFADGLRIFSKESSKKPCFVFFPMNAIQFGLSDLLSAYRLQRILGPEVDFRVWEADASLDGVLSLLRKLDIAITMRFHAAAFALSQNCKVIAIDYRIGRKDKVAGLMDDFGLGENCSRIDLLTAEWLAKKLKKLITDQSFPPFFPTHFKKHRSASSAPLSQENSFARNSAASASFSRKPGSSKKR